MPFTEFVTPSFKQGEATRETFLTQKTTLLQTIISSVSPGHLFSGLMVTENNINVESEFKFLLGLEWENKERFVELVTSDKFKTFRGTLNPFLLAPPQPQLYETDLSPLPAFTAPVTEAFRITKHGNSDEIEIAWQEMIAALKAAPLAISSLSGSSVNLESEMFAGVIGWDSLEVRESTLNDPQVAQAKENLERIQDSTSFVVKFSPLN